MHRSCAKFSMFSSQFPSAAWREVAVSDMSSKNWDGMRSMWDLCPTISKIIKRRRTCRRRSLLRVLWKSAPSPCERCGHVEAEWGTKSPATFFCHSDDVNRSPWPCTNCGYVLLMPLKRILFEVRWMRLPHFWRWFLNLSRGLQRITSTE